MKLKLNMMAAVLAAGVAWNLAGAAEPDKAVPDKAVPDKAMPDKAVPDRAKLQDEINAMFRRAGQQPGDKNARIELNKSVFENGETVRQKFNEILPPSDLYQYVLVRRLMMTAAERLYNDAPTAENRQRLTAYRKGGHRLAGA